MSGKSRLIVDLVLENRDLKENIKGLMAANQNIEEMLWKTQDELKELRNKYNEMEGDFVAAALKLQAYETAEQERHEAGDTASLDWRDFNAAEDVRIKAKLAKYDAALGELHKKTFTLPPPDPDLIGTEYGPTKEE